MANQQNNIGLITKYSTKAWDKVYKQESVTSILDSEERRVQFLGAKTVRIAKLEMGGMNDYYRNNNNLGFGDTRVPNAVQNGIPANNFVGAADFGYQKSPAQLVWEEMTLRQDRAAAFQIEYFDNEESGDLLVGSVVSEVSRTKIIPEVDAYTLSTIASYAMGDGIVNEDITTAPLAALNRAFVYFDTNEVPAERQIVYCSPNFMAALRNTQEVTKFLTQADYRPDRNISFRIEKYEGRTLIVVSPQRLRTNIVTFDGGYTWGANSQAINFLAVDKDAVYHIVKYDRVKVISGDTNLAARGFDGYTVFARIYYDVFVPDNKRVAIYVSLPATAAAAPAMSLDLRFDANNAITNITWVPGDKWGYVVTSTAALNVGDAVTDLSTLTQVQLGDVAPVGTTVYYFIGLGASGLEVKASFSKTVTE